MFRHDCDDFRATPVNAMNHQSVSGPEAGCNGSYPHAMSSPPTKAAPFLYLIGYPGAGKQTVAREML